jgi:hypothetical protein
MAVHWITDYPGPTLSALGGPAPESVMREIWAEVEQRRIKITESDRDKN